MIRPYMRVSVLGVLAVLVLSLLPAARAQAPASSQTRVSEIPRITQAINDSAVVRIPRTTHPLATPANDRGRADANLAMNRMVLLLKPSTAQQAALGKFIDSQHDSESPNYQKWLEPEQYAAQFGPAASDLNQITSWLKQHNFTIGSVARGGQWIEFSGNVEQVETTFHTEMHNYLVKGESHVANSMDISIPQALAPVVRGVVSLHDFRPKPLHSQGFQVHRDATTGKLVPVKTPLAGAAGANPEFTLPGTEPPHFLAPGDWSLIYNTAPLLAQNITGAGVSIAVVGSDTNIQPSDVLIFRAIFGLPTKNFPSIIINGEDPGITPGSAGEIEADLDVEWSGAIAPDANIKFVTTASTFTTFGGLLSSSYIIDNRVAPIMSSSIGQCEAFLGDTGNALLNAIYEQAAAEGISVFVAAGDTGPAGCDPQESTVPAQDGAEVSGYASTPYNTAVGGTMLAENGLDGNYWTTFNQPNLSSVIGYIPETVWNESCDPTTDPNQCGDGLYHLSSAGGGASNCSQSTVQGDLIFCQGGYSKPSWQSGKGVPKDGARDLPDIAFTSAGGHDGYLMCVEGTCQATVVDGQVQLESAFVVGGTSAAAPTMSGLMGLIEQSTGTYQGLVNYNFYKLAALQNPSNCNSTHFTNPNNPSPCIFNDVTAGNNNVPGQIGFNASPGYDMATGLGSINAANLLNSWGSITKLPTTTKLQASAIQVQHGQAISMSVAVTPSSGTGVPTGDFALVGTAGSVFGGTLANGSFSGSVNGLPGGSYKVKAQYSGDAMFASSTSGAVNVNVTPEDSIVNVEPVDVNPSGVAVPLKGSIPYSTAFGLQINVQGKSGIGSATGTVTFQMGQTPLGNLLLNQSGSVFADLSGVGIVPGSHTFTISYSGDNSFHASTSTLTVNVIKGPSSTSITPLQQVVTAGVPVELVLLVNGFGGFAPSGTVQLYDCGANSPATCPNGTPLGKPLTLSPSGPLGFRAGTGASQAVYKGTFSAGNHTLKLAYSGDAKYNSVAVGSSDASREVLNVKAPNGMEAQIKIKQSPAPLAIFTGGTETYTITVRPPQEHKSMPTGTVSLSDQFGDFLGAPVALTNGNATIAVQWSRSGSFLIFVNYSGDANYTLLSSPVLTTTLVLAPPPTLELSSSVAKEPENTNCILAVNVLVPFIPNVNSPAAEGGQVLFLDYLNAEDAVELGQGPQPITTDSSGNGIATLSVILPPGKNLIVAIFFGTQDWLGAESNPILVQVTTPPPPTTTSGWTWVSGSNQSAQTGIFGKLGIAAPTNAPGSRNFGLSWTDADGNFWLFGGYGEGVSTNPSGDLNDLWKFSNGEWTWMAGSDQVEQPSIFGIKGKAAPGNIPSARSESVSAKDASGNVWVFGGTAINSNGVRGRYNDLWKFSNGQWAWMSGSIDPDQVGVYGTMGVADPKNVPGGRFGHVAWTDAKGNFWVFGGEGWDSTGTIGILNDLWEFSNGQWTWMGGSDKRENAGNYGTKGVASPNNFPGARANAASWTDADGNFWLFGGSGLGGGADLNDLWEYSHGEWTWVKGTDHIGVPGIYGTQGVASKESMPGSRDGATVFVDASGAAWLFGGETVDSIGGEFVSNDLWKFSNGEWTWVSGSNLSGEIGIYGTEGVTNAVNVPGARRGTTSWMDSSGNFWLFGGVEDFTIFGSPLTIPNLNDLWKFTPPSGPSGASTK